MDMVNNWKIVLCVLMLSAFLLQSCGNFDIVKRRYRPGFHVDINKKKDRNSKAKPQSRDAELAVEPVHPKEAVLRTQSIQVGRVENELSQLEVSQEIEPLVKSRPTIDELMLAPFKEARKTKLDGSLRRAVFKEPKEEKYGWSAISFTSLGLGVAAMALMITGIVLLALFVVGGSFFYWWIFTLVGFLIGVAAMVTGIVGLRKTGAGEKRGRGFALTGMLAGIVAMAGGLITLFWGLLHYMINGGNTEDL